MRGGVGVRARFWSLVRELSSRAARGPGLWEVPMGRNQSSLREGKAQPLALGKDHSGETASDQRAGRRLEGLGGCWGYG